MRVGLGADAHELVEGRRLVLGGVELDSPRGLAGHSDGDVIAHALVDAILGAAGLGDIGGLFPSGAAEWEAHHSSVTASDVLLAAFRRRFEQRSYEEFPYLWRYLDGVASAELEQSLIDAGAIRALGYRFVGMPRSGPSFQGV